MTTIFIWDRDMAEEINMVPPEPSNRKYTFAKEKKFEIMTRNTGVMFRCDEADWKKAKDCMWYEVRGQIINGQRILFEDYVGIKGYRKQESPKLDLRRIHYDRGY